MKGCNRSLPAVSALRVAYASAIAVGSGVVTMIAVWAAGHEVPHRAMDPRSRIDDQKIMLAFEFVELREDFALRLPASSRRQSSNPLAPGTT